MQLFERIDRHGQLVPITDRAAAIREGETVHRVLRPALSEDYLGEIDQLAGEGTMLAQLWDEGAVRAVALWRVFNTTYCGRRLEIDDLVTDPDSRSKGYGHILLSWLEARGAALGCPTLTLNSATKRMDAHRFYFRERYVVRAFHFVKILGDAVQ